MAEKGVYITGEVLDLFWDCLDEDILDNEFQEQIENVLKEVKNLEKHYILVKPSLRRILSVFHFSRFLSFFKCAICNKICKTKRGL